MAAIEMYDYLSTVTPDNDVTLSVSPQKTLVELGTKNQTVHLADDDSEERISFSDDSIFYVTLQWPRKSETDLGTVLDFYYNTAKGNGRLKSFKWQHPTDGHVYVVRFDCNAERQIQIGNIHGFVNVKFKVLGRVLD